MTPHLQGGEQQIFLAVKDVYQVAQGPGIESRRLHMDVDTAGGVGEGPLVTELPHQFLNGGDVLVGADGADHFGFVGCVSGHALPMFLLLCE